MSRLRASLAFLAVLAALAVAGVAFAQAQVLVQVRNAQGAPAEATVTLTPEGGGQAHSCRTSGGTCRLPAVPPGRYVVTAQPAGEGQPPIPRPVPVVGGTMTVSVTLR